MAIYFLEEAFLVKKKKKLGWYSGKSSGLAINRHGFEPELCPIVKVLTDAHLYKTQFTKCHFGMSLFAFLSCLQVFKNCQPPTVFKSF